jgi:hypothetical protein
VRTAPSVRYGTTFPDHERGLGRREVVRGEAFDRILALEVARHVARRVDRIAIELRELLALRLLRRRMIDLEERHACTRQASGSRVVARAQDHDLANRELVDRETDEAIEIRDAQREPHLHRRKPRIETLGDLVSVGAGDLLGPRIDEQRLFPFARPRAVRTDHERGLRRGAMDIHLPPLLTQTPRYFFASICVTRPLYAAVTRIESSVAAFWRCGFPACMSGWYLRMSWR